MTNTKVMLEKPITLNNALEVIDYLNNNNYMPEDFDIFDNPLSKTIWLSKYRFYTSEVDIPSTLRRCVRGIYVNDHKALQALAEVAVAQGLFMPAGRIIAGADTSKRVTLMNCYVNATMEDSMEGIVDGLGNIMLTQQQGGGIGTDFSTLRPTGALLSRTGSYASGPLPFMDTWNAACSTIMSAGDRRGAMMGTMSDTHPDLPKFIAAKHEKGRLTNFNVSVLVSDAFMEAVFDDEEWCLYFNVAPYHQRPAELEQWDFVDEQGMKQYVYSVWRARDLWDLITRSTYEYSEPGVIFIDRVNELNNLQYVENIRCTNPCGEQPLPPHGTCNLGAINLTQVIKNPFTPEAEIDWLKLHYAAAIGVRFLDNVIEVTNYPLEAQKVEEYNKRRIGLGISGLADALAMLGIRYGSTEAVRTYEAIQQAITLSAYTTSVHLAKERGSFPLFSAPEFFRGFAGTKLPEELQRQIALNGIRNGVLLTIAPTGTTSILFGDISSGIEPVFAREAKRNVRQPDDSFKQYTTYNFSARLWKYLNPDLEYPRYMVEADDLKVYEHIAMQEAGQRWIDASISKTINVPENYSFEEFQDAYKLAYEAGLKGCTTYRPSATRGAILVKEGAETKSEAPTAVAAPSTYARPQTLHSVTCKVKWPNLNSALYITLGFKEDGTPYEVFLNSKDQRFTEWMTTTTLMLSWLIRSGTPFEVLCDELRQIHSMEGAFAEQQYRPSLVSFIGAKLKEMYNTYQGGVNSSEELAAPASGAPDTEAPKRKTITDVCSSCGSYNTYYSEGCMKCRDCGYSKCG